MNIAINQEQHNINEIPIEEFRVFDNIDSQEKYDSFLERRVYTQNNLEVRLKLLYKAFSVSLFNTTDLLVDFDKLYSIVNRSNITCNVRDLKYSYIIGGVFRNEHREIIMAKLILETEKPHGTTTACNFFASHGPVSVLKSCGRTINYENICTIMSIFVDILGLYSHVSTKTILNEKMSFYDIFSNDFKDYKNNYKNKNNIEDENYDFERNIDIKSISTLEENKCKILKTNSCRMIIDNYDLFIMPLKIRTVLLLKSRFIKYIGAEKQIKDSLLLYHKLIRSETDFEKLNNALLINREILTNQLFYESLIQYKPYEFSVMSEPLKVYEKETLYRMKILKEKPLNEFFSKKINWVTKFLPVFALIVTFGFSLAGLILSLKNNK